MGDDADAEAGIYACESTYLDRYVQLGVASSRVISVSFPETPDEEAAVLDPAELDHPLLDRIFEYLDGVSTVEFDDVTVALTVPTAQREVLERVRAIPYGQQADVTTVAGSAAGLDADDQDDLITVRTALDENPLPLIVPDHRVRDGPSAAPPDVEQKLRSLEEL